MLARKRPQIRPNLVKGTQKTTTEVKNKAREEEIRKEVDSVKTKDTITAPTATGPLITETPIITEVRPQGEDVASWPPEQKRISRVPVVAPASPIPTEYTDYSPERKNPRKKFNGEEKLDTKNMRIMDMIYWNPKKGQTLSRKRHNTDSSQAPTPTVTPKPSQSRPAAPQVKIGPDGNIILDETSLVVEGAPAESTFWEAIDDVSYFILQ